jgi:hypothetical protein
LIGKPPFCLVEQRLRSVLTDKFKGEEEANCMCTASSHPHLPAASRLPGLRDYSSGPRPGASDRHKGLASPSLLANVVVAKYCDHLPLYRQSQAFARHGVEIDRSTLANWLGGTCWCLT